MTRPRRKLTALDDPLETPVARPTEAAALRPSVAATRREGQSSAAEAQALFVRIPAAQADALARAAFELRLHKQEIVASLIARHVDPHSPQGLDAVRALVDGYRAGHG